MKFLAGLLTQNLLYKLVAVLIAIVLWAAVQGSQSIEVSLDLPIELEERPPSLVVVDQSASEVNVKIVGSRAAVRRAEKELSSYRIPLGGVNAGEARFSVNAEQLQLPRGAQVLARSPSTVILQLEPVARKKVRVRADIVGEPPAGYKLVGISVDPSEVLLEGATGSIRKIREVLTDRVDVSEIRETTTQDIPLVFSGLHVWRADAEGEPVKLEIRLEPVPSESAAGEPGRDTG